MTTSRSAGKNRLVTAPLCYRRAPSLLLLSVVGIPLLYLQVREFGKGGFRDDGYYVFSAWGWPMRAVDKLEEGPIRELNATTVQWTWYPDGLAIDFVISLLILVSVAFIGEKFRNRKRPPWQFTMRSILVVFAVVSIVALAYTSEIAVRRDPIGYYIYIKECNFGDAPWFVVGPVLVGIGCMIYMLGSLVLWPLRAVFRFVANREHLQIGDESDK